MKKFAVLAVGILSAFAVLAKDYSLTDQPFKLKPFEGNPDKAWMAYDFDDSSWVSQKQPAQWQMLPQFDWKYSGKMFYRAKFDFKPEPGKTYYLRFNGVFYSANIWLNGYYMGKHTGYFAPFEFDATSQLRGKNVLAMEVDCPREKNEHDKTFLMGVWSYWDVISWKRSPGGIWKGVSIVEAGTARFRHVWIGTKNLEGENARIQVYGEMRSLPLSREPYKIAIDLAPENFSGKSFHLEFGLTGEPGENYFKKEFTLEKPELWSTWDQGKPNLYKVSVKAVLEGKVQDETNFTTGIRTIEKRCQPGQHKEGLCWQFVLNGKPIYIRGNNYAPGDAFMSRAMPETYKKDVALAVAANYNMLRVHAHIDRPELYEEADRAGLLLWQDFPLHGMYKHGPVILEQAVLQAPEMVYLLGSHPSIAIWSCHNEPGATKFDWEVRAMDRKVKKILEHADGTRPVNLASGLVGDTDAHLYFGWYIGQADGFAKAWNYPILQGSMAFITEWGAQSFPPYEDSLRFMDPDIRKADWKDLEEHYLLQKKNMDKYVPLKPGEDLKTYIDSTEEYQARLHKFHIDWTRSYKYLKNWGAVPFLFNDANPAITWAVVDYERTPKKAYYAMQMGFQPVYACARWRFAPYRKGQTVKLPVFAVNDLLQTYDAKVDAEITHDGKKVAGNSWQAKLAPDMPAKKIGEVSFKADQAGDYILKLTLTAPGLEKPVENITALKVGGE